MGVPSTGPGQWRGVLGGLPVLHQVRGHRGIWALPVAAPERAPQGCWPVLGPPHGRAGGGGLVTKESAKARHSGNLPPLPCLDERGKWSSQARSASRSLMGRFPVTCWKEEPGGQAARPRGMSPVDGDTQHAQNTRSVCIRDEPTSIPRVVDTPGGMAARSLGFVPSSTAGPGDGQRAQHTCSAGSPTLRDDSPTENAPLGGGGGQWCCLPQCSLPPLASVLSRAGCPGRGAHKAGGRVGRASCS